MSSSCNTLAVRAIILVSLWFVLYSPVIKSLWGDWIGQSDNSHGLLVPFISLYFAWEKREKLGDVVLSNSRWGVVILVFSILIYVVSFAGDIAFFSRLMMILSLIGLILFNFGKHLFRIFLFPLLFLFFMIPVPVSLVEKISIPLQIFASTVSANLINLFSIPVLQEGNMLYFAQTQLEVAQACSGLRSIVALTMLSVIFTYLLQKGLIKKIILLASAIPIALIANIMRVTVTGILAHYYGGVIARGFLHEFSGLVVFVFGFFVLYLEFALLNKICAKKWFALKP